MGYEIVALWGGRTKAERAAHPHTDLFNQTGHIRDALAMWTVPACIRYVGGRLCPTGTPAERLQRIREARRGDAELVETHPRILLYSALERNYLASQGQPRSDWLNLSYAATRYDKAPSHRE